MLLLLLLFIGLVMVNANSMNNSTDVVDGEYTMTYMNYYIIDNIVVAWWKVSMDMCVMNRWRLVLM
jgi:hypothetical protein